MQEKNSENPFKAMLNLHRVEFNTKYANLPLLDLIFEEIAVSTASYELSSKNIEAIPEDIWKYILYFDREFSEKEIRNYAEKYIDGDIEFFIEDETNWVEKISKEAKPVIAGDFYISNEKDIHNSPANLIPILINPGMAFGTGEHQTSSGCLELISSLKIEPKTILDVGSGSGILAIGAKKKWPNSLVEATEIDEVAMEVARENFYKNQVNISITQNYDIESSSDKYELIISNILANPLIEMAPDFSKILKKSGKIILSGFIEKQLEILRNSYEQTGFKYQCHINKDNWIIALFSLYN